MESFAFKRSQRLLTSREYQRTFDRAKLRFSCPVLLVLAAERVAPVAGQPTVQGDEQTVVPARLGLIVAKKHLKKAVDRNRFKRISRESFRHNQTQLVGLDLIVLARAGAKNTTGQELAELLEKSWRYIERKRRKQSSTHTE